MKRYFCLEGDNLLPDPACVKVRGEPPSTLCPGNSGKEQQLVAIEPGSRSGPPNSVLPHAVRAVTPGLTASFSRP